MRRLDVSGDTERREGSSASRPATWEAVRGGACLPGNLTRDHVDARRHFSCKGDEMANQKWGLSPETPVSPADKFCNPLMSVT